MTPNHDLSYKLLAGGAGGVGKTTFLYRYLTQNFVTDTKLTVGVQLHSHVTERQGKNVSLIIWDLGGQDRFRFVQPSYVRGASAALAFYDLSRIGTLLQLREWIKMYRAHGSPGMPIVLVGTKADIVDADMEAMAIEEGNAFAAEHDLHGHVITSSKTGFNVHEAFASMLDALLLQKMEAAPKTPAPGLRESVN